MRRKNDFLKLYRVVCDDNLPCRVCRVLAKDDEDVLKALRKTGRKLVSVEDMASNRRVEF